MCGKHLADFLHDLCRHLGGFHAPENKRTDLHSRQISEESAVEQSEQQRHLSTVLQSGVVDECCRKQCTLSTLISYCANGEQVSADRLSELQNLFSSNSETFSENQMGENVMEMMTENPDSVRNSHSLMNTGASMPNLGTNSRNRPVFIVLPQTYEDAGSNSSPEENNGHSF
ncbi:bombyxin B-2 [Trichonephila inaurata madagascariensis]|uniref:Bombyxin B-2 n=1 Tax=Trichonephila inaurata madagascariensis TaxID=2747483 RepID=A0A8X6IQZ2_9ARAC|nr:bombyxin B-2 [Trichonephila inaurata madagascariensis]